MEVILFGNQENVKIFKSTKIPLHVGQCGKIKWKVNKSENMKIFSRKGKVTKMYSLHQQNVEISNSARILFPARWYTKINQVKSKLKWKYQKV